MLEDLVFAHEEIPRLKDLPTEKWVWAVGRMAESA